MSASADQASDGSPMDTANVHAALPGAPDPALRLRAAAIVAGPARAREPELELRRLPVYARSAVTFDTILDAAACLLEEGGGETVTTNLVADVARVNIATLYQYFPGRESILLALYRRDSGRRLGTVEQLLQGLGSNERWRDQLGAIVDRLVELRRIQLGSAQLRRAMLASPALRPYFLAGTERRKEVLARELLTRGRLDEARAHWVATCAYESFAAMVDLWARGLGDRPGYRDDPLIEQTKAQMFAYLGPFLDP